MFWDVRAQKLLSQSASDRKQNADQKTNLTPYGVPNTFKHLERTWKPLFRVLQGLRVQYKTHDLCRTITLFFGKHDFYN